MLARLLDALLRTPAPRQILLVQVPSDDARRAALEEKSRAVRESMGTRWIAHANNRVLSDAQRAERAQRELAQALESTNLRSLPRKKATR